MRKRSFGNTVIAGVTVVALCTGAWLLRSGAETHAPPQPSAAQAHSRTGGTGGRAG
ncbi:class F sortase, partial [Streptomyces sp. 12257]|nr:class F sortase [Streptomyces sp. 12257]